MLPAVAQFLFFSERFLSLCGCGVFCGTTRLQLGAVAFWVLLVLHLWTRCGSGVFFHKLHGTA
jgi:hypothetical protein